MSSNEQLSIVQSKIGSTGKVITTITGHLLYDSIQNQRLLTVVENVGDTTTTFAVFVFIQSRTPPLFFSDLTFERALPVDDEFSCVIESETEPKTKQNLIYLHINSRNNIKLKLQLGEGAETSSFISEVYRIIDITSQTSTFDFKWLSSYTNRSTNNMMEGFYVDNLTFTESEIDGNELAIPRQNIAKGMETPVRARENAIRMEMEMKENEYTDLKTFSIYCGTWNVNGQATQGISLVEWLVCDVEPPDILAIGFQELDLSKEAFLFNETPKEDDWQLAVTMALNKFSVRYKRIQLVRLVGIMMIVFAQDKHCNYIKNVAYEVVGTGLMGKMGNKGGVAVRFDLHATSICFVNSHLAAHVEEFERRNQDYSDINSRLIFQRAPHTPTIRDHNQVYWLGDLNYRVTSVDVTVVKDYLSRNSLKPILEKDQLNMQKNISRVFNGYKEGEIHFQPTYKYDTGTDNWDSSEKHRAPAWCDRVLWRGDGIEQLEYRSHPSLKLSDHKPVSALFRSKIKVINVARYRQVLEDVMKKQDKLENEFLPQVMVDSTDIIFDTIRYLEPCSKELTVANTGQVPVKFEFIKKLNDFSYCKEWLRIDPAVKKIEPGQKCDVKLEIFVDKKSAYKLNSGQDKLYDILVLHLEGGKDIFVTVTGTYERSCFGSSVEALVHIPVPVREIPVGKLVDLENNKCSNGPEPYPIPKEIWFLIDHLYRHGLKQPHLFQQPGMYSEIIDIRNWLDNGSSDPLPGSVHSVAEALILLLESTCEPIIPYNLHNICYENCNSYQQCKQIVSRLPEHRKNVFLYLCSFLQELLSHSLGKELDTKTLATMFGSIFLRDPPRGGSKDRRDQQLLDRKKSDFVNHFLINDQSEFILGR